MTDFSADSPARLGTYAYVNPIVAVLLGWAIAGERLSVRTAVAAGDCDLRGCANHHSMQYDESQEW